MGSSTFASPAQEMRHIVQEAMRRNEGRSRASHIAARDLGLSERRVRGICSGEVGRIWADELEMARAWYARFCEQQMALAEEQKALWETRRTALARQIGR